MSSRYSSQTYCHQYIRALAFVTPSSEEVFRVESNVLMIYRGLNGGFMYRVVLKASQEIGLETLFLLVKSLCLRGVLHFSGYLAKTAYDKMCAP